MVGSAPVESTKMIGVSGFESWNEAARSKGGTSTKCFPIWCMMNFVTPSTTFSSRRTRMTSSFWKRVSCVSQSPGRASSWGARQSNHRFHPPVSVWKDGRRPSNMPSLSRFTRPPSWSVLIQSSPGFEGSDNSSTNPPLVRKKAHSSSVMLFSSRRMIWMAIMKENIFLSFSKSPRHTLVYTSSVTTLIMMPTRSSTTSLFALRSMHPLNSDTKNWSEYWYIGSTAPKSATTK
mmetsp:Transcript_48496/g.115429  ORF Transcript_48496/g.115429 Transcript_48496/m.115429 type:complete len:233 (-) Transcript_48496:1718-2416(-)